MIRNVQLKFIFRSLLKSKIYERISNFGLALGFTSFFEMLFYLINGFSCDRFQNNYRRICQVNTEYKNFSSAFLRLPGSNWAICHIPEIEKTSAASRMCVEIQSNGTWRKVKRLAYTTNFFFDTFTFHVLACRIRVLGDEIVLRQIAAHYHLPALNNPVEPVRYD